MFSQSFESIISITYIPPWYFFKWAAKIGVETQMKKLFEKGFDIWNLVPIAIGMRFVQMLSFGEICPMFTGIIETQGIIKKIKETGANKSFWIKSSISQKLKIDQSVAHDGVCLTIVEIKNNRHRVTAIDETLSKSTLANWQAGNAVNLERCLRLNARLDGHIVQGHVDAVGTCVKKEEKEGSWLFNFQFPEKFSGLIIEKGSITINGISLTVFNVSGNTFDVAIIPYTFDSCNIKYIEPGHKVNLEFDMIGKYINRKLSLTR